jgi:hypothetical protein
VLQIAGSEGYSAERCKNAFRPDTEAKKDADLTSADVTEDGGKHATVSHGAARRSARGGAGLGINVISGSGWLLRAAWSWRTGHEVATSDTPRSGRGWLQLAKFF